MLTIRYGLAYAALGSLRSFAKNAPSVLAWRPALCRLDTGRRYLSPLRREPDRGPASWLHPGRGPIHHQVGWSPYRCTPMRSWSSLWILRKIRPWYLSAAFRASELSVDIVNRCPHWRLAAEVYRLRRWHAKRIMDASHEINSGIVELRHQYSLWGRSQLQSCSALSLMNTYLRIYKL